MASLPPFPLPQPTPSMMRVGVFNAMSPARISSNPAKDAQLAGARAIRQPSLAARNPEQSTDDALWATFNGERPTKSPEAPRSESDLYERVYGA